MVKQNSQTKVFKIKPILIVLLLAFFVGIGFLIKVDKVEALTCAEGCAQKSGTSLKQCETATCNWVDGYWYYCSCRWQYGDNCTVIGSIKCTASGCCVANCNTGGCYTYGDNSRCPEDCGSTNPAVLKVQGRCSGCGGYGASGSCSYSETLTCNSSSLCTYTPCSKWTYYCTNAGGSYAWRTSTACDDGNSCNYT